MPIIYLMLILLVSDVTGSTLMWNPMKPQPIIIYSREELPKSLLLDMIVVGKKNKFVIIGDREKRVGDVISGFKIIKIDTDNVILERKGEYYNLDVE